MKEKLRGIVVGLGIQGKKRLLVAGDAIRATVDPVLPNADYTSLQDVPLDSYDFALVCTPDSAKFEILRYLLENDKHLLVEKPILFESEEEATQLSTLLKQSPHLACYTAYNHRFEPHLATVKELLEKNSIGKSYLLKMFYGNGTARDVRDSAWRDKGGGVIPDLGSHLLDTVLFFYGELPSTFELVRSHTFENQAPDHFLIHGQGAGPSMFLEGTLASWRNTFRLDIFGELGSLHVECLCKWGPSTLTARKRVLPSGRPEEQIETIECADPTWGLEYQHFLSLCEHGGSNLENDKQISDILKNLTKQMEAHS